MANNLRARLDRIEHIINLARVDDRGFLDRAIADIERQLAYEYSLPAKELAAYDIEREALYREQAVASLTAPDLPHGPAGTETWYLRECQEIDRRAGRRLLAEVQQ